MFMLTQYETAGCPPHFGTELPLIAVKNKLNNLIKSRRFLIKWNNNPKVFDSGRRFDCKGPISISQSDLILQNEE